MNNPMAMPYMVPQPGIAYQQPVYNPPVQTMQQPVYRPSNVMGVQQAAFSMIPGRVINNVEDIRPNEVPNDGSVAVFPQNDGSCVYLKYFTGDGRINTIKFVAESSPDIPIGDGVNTNDGFAAINQRLDKIEKLISKRLYKKPYQSQKKEAVSDAPGDE